MCEMRQDPCSRSDNPYRSIRCRGWDRDLYYLPRCTRSADAISCGALALAKMSGCVYLYMIGSPPLRTFKCICVYTMSNDAPESRAPEFVWLTGTMLACTCIVFLSRLHDACVGVPETRHFSPHGIYSIDDKRGLN